MLHCHFATMYYMYKAVLAQGMLPLYNILHMLLCFACLLHTVALGFNNRPENFTFS